MRVQITARHCQVSDNIRERATAVATKLTRYDHRLSQVEIIFEQEKLTKKIEAVVSVPGGEPVVARGEGSGFREALDALEERLIRILRRRHDRRLQRRQQGNLDMIPQDT